MIGHESCRPAAKPRLGSGVPRGSASVGVESAPPVPGWLPHAPDARTRGAKLVACAAEGGSESTRELRSTWARTGLRLRVRGRTKGYA